MARNPLNVNIWEDAWVYIAFVTGARPAIPADLWEPFDPDDWPEVGLLNGEDGFTEARSREESKHYAWGTGLYRRGSKNYETGGSFAMLEQNATTDKLIYPGSVRPTSGTTTTKQKMPRGVMGYLALETRSDIQNRERRISTMPAEFWIENNDRNESDPTKWAVNYVLFADGSGDIFDWQLGPHVDPTP